MDSTSACRPRLIAASFSQSDYERNRSDAPIADRASLSRITSNIIPETFEVLVTVEDAGIGIDRKDKDRIFDAFFKTKPAGTGTQTCHRQTIIESLGGSLRASANNPCGTIFHVALPSSGVCERTGIATGYAHA
jgi:signal transduction histidine kinase